MKIYIAGKYTGLGHTAACQKFFTTEAQLVAAGIAAEDIIVPVKFVPEGTDWPTAMRICIPLLMLCNAIYIQRDWHDSFGAKQEITKAMQEGITPYYEEQNDIALLVADYNAETLLP